LEVGQGVVEEGLISFEHLLFTIDGRENLTNTVTQIQNIYIPITIITYDVGLYATMYKTGLALR